MARPIFSFEELCTCMVPFPAELNLRLRMSTQVKFPCRDGWLRNVGIGHDHVLAVAQTTPDYRARLATAKPHGSEEQSPAACTDRPAVGTGGREGVCRLSAKATGSSATTSATTGPAFLVGDSLGLCLTLHHGNSLLSVRGHACGLIMERPPRSGKGKPYGRHKKLLLLSSNLAPRVRSELGSSKAPKARLTSFSVPSG